MRKKKVKNNSSQLSRTQASEPAPQTFDLLRLSNNVKCIRTKIKESLLRMAGEKKKTESDECGRCWWHWHLILYRITDAHHGVDMCCEPKSGPGKILSTSTNLAELEMVVGTFSFWLFFPSPAAFVHLLQCRFFTSTNVEKIFTFELHLWWTKFRVGEKKRKKELKE